MAGGGTANGKEKEKGSKEKKRRDESGDSSDSSPDRSKSKKKQSRDGRSSKKRCALSNNLKTLKRCLYSSFTHIPLCRRDSSSSSSSSSDSSSESSSDSSSDSSRSVVSLDTKLRELQELTFLRCLLVQEPGQGEEGEEEGGQGQ